MAYEEIVFSEKQQSALLGYVISDEKIFDAATAYGVTESWFTSTNDHRVFKALREFVAKNKRRPSLEELKSDRLFTAEEDKIKVAGLKALDVALASKDVIGYDVLAETLKTWAMARMVREAIESTVDIWNRQDVAKAFDRYLQGAVDFQRMDSQGASASTYDSETWSIRERQDRADMRSKMIMTGVKFIDDAMDGVSPDDLVLVVSKTGVGKSQLLAQIALNATAAGKKVFLLALEASPGEMQRRLKFPTLMRLYREAVRNGKAKDVHIDYVKYCHGTYTDLLEPFEDAAHADYVAKYGSMKTLYKHSASYTTEDMERDIMRMAPKVDLILLDHLHYVDGKDKETENEAANKLIKKLREVGQSMRKPIIAAAHVRKTTEQRKFAPLLPNVEDIHGSSNFGKVATHVIILGPTQGLDPEHFDLSMAPKIDGVPTLIRMVKSRTAGIERTQYTAVCYFQQREGRYSANYNLGRLYSADTKWTPVFANNQPEWAAGCSPWKAPGLT